MGAPGKVPWALVDFGDSTQHMSARGGLPGPFDIVGVFEAAIVALMAAGGGTLHVDRPGDYTFSRPMSQITLTSDLTIEWHPAARFVGPDGQTAPLLNFRGASGTDRAHTLRLARPNIDVSRGAYTGNQPSAIQVVNLETVIVEQPTLYGGTQWTGVTIGGDSGIEPINIGDFQCLGGTIAGFADSGVYWGGGNNEAANDNGVRFLIDKTLFLHCGNGVVGKRDGNLGVVTNCYFELCGIGVATAEVGAGQQQSTAGRLEVRGNRFKKCSNRAIEFRAKTRGAISDNIIEDWGYSESGGTLLGAPNTRCAIFLNGSRLVEVDDNVMEMRDWAANGHIGIYEAGYRDQAGVLWVGGANTGSNRFINVPEPLRQGKLVEGGFDVANSVAASSYEDNYVSGPATPTFNNLYKDTRFEYSQAGTPNKWLQIYEGASDTVGLATRYQVGGPGASFAGGTTAFQIAPAADKDLELAPATGKVVRVPRAGTPTQYMSFFGDGSGQHVRGVSPAASAKKTQYESNADGVVSGGALGHLFLVDGTSVLDMIKTTITALVPIILAADPTTALGAATKQYVDAQRDTRLPITGGGSMQGKLVVQQRLADDTGIDVDGDGAGAVVRVSRWFDSAIATQVNGRKARGSKASPTVIATNDQVFQIVAQAYGGSDFRTLANIYFAVVDASPSDTSMEGEFVLNLTPAGAVATSRTLSVRASTGLSYGGSGNVFLNSSRHFVLRSYTVATLPSASPGAQMIYCSDLGGGGDLLVSNGTVWLRTRSGYQTVSTDADSTLTVLTNAEEIRHTGMLTADRTITLSTTGAYNGARFRVTRTGGGAFNLSLGGLKNLAQNQWAEVIYNGSAWYLAAYGAL